MMRFLVVAASLLLPAVPAVAQVATGSYAFGTFDNHGFDTVNVGNLNVHFGVPILNKSGRGLPFYYNLSYDSSVWYPSTVSGSSTWVPVPNFGWRGDTEIAVGYMTYTSTGSVDNTSQQGTCYLYSYGNWVYHDSFGVSHSFAGTTSFAEKGSGYGGSNFSCPTNQPSLTSTASDQSGYTVTVDSYTNVSALFTRGAATIEPASSFNGSGVITDPNGNQVSTDGNGNFTDTTGKVVLQVAGNTSSAQTFTYTDTTGTSRAVAVNYKAYTVQTNFGCSGIGDQGATATFLVDTITLPDNTTTPSTYHFSYEVTPGYPNSVTGRLASVTLSGGGAIGYAYTGSNNGIVCADGSAAGLTRTMLKDSPNSSWTYTRKPVATTSHTDVVDGKSNRLSYDFVTATMPSEAQQPGAFL